MESDDDLRKDSDDDLRKDVEILLEFDRQREQREAALAVMVGMYGDVFNGFLGEGLTREESLELTRTIIMHYGKTS